MASGAIERFDDKARASFESTGKTTVYRGELLRHPIYTRLLHWSVALFFFALQALNWFEHMLWTPGDTRWMRNIKRITSGEEKMDPPETGFFNAGQKVQFWEIVGGSVVYLFTGIVLWGGAKTFGRIPVAISYVLHDISAVIMLGGIFVHIYLSTIGEPGTFQSMIRGAVSEAWAWTFHPAWYKRITGRDPVQACEEARREMNARRNPHISE
jgi:formate dehydrogenase subunit gamma